MNRTAIFAIAAIIISATGVGLYLSHNNSPDVDTDNGDAPPQHPEIKDMKLIMTVDGNKVDVNWEDNPSVDAIKELARDTLTIEMHRYGGFEQTGSMAKSIVRNDSHISVDSGDVVLYNGIQVCLYYAENSYNFTRLGKISGMTDSEITEMLDRANVTTVFTLG